ncbi:YcnI family protein [Nonomuraea sp. NEAU-A123]|uniref:YcnI family copper-binding membrane protein n=1 Tax=Nonomuraea sp. NEAU-A123 TaxID=2839649 RepID=UPI001BE3F881|nr:YcnI family protein [Nonomuraea sp. NEAU-A123]MBT2226545.1 YcnI family protein [Nonomuraea sp. NEAU-A123]
MLYRRIGTIAAAALALTVGLAVPALAHVSINPGTAEKGGWTKLAFRVPNERDDASTTKLVVTFPTDHPLPFVSVKPVPGWKAELTEGKLPEPIVADDGDKVTESVLKITWTGGKIEPGQFQEFEVSVGPLPKDVDEIAFPTEQTYSGGEVVKWADEPKADGTEAEHPTPTLKLVAASGGDEHAGMAMPAASPPATQAAQSVAMMKQAASSPVSDGTARIMGVAGIIVGLVGGGIGLVGFRRRSTTA